MIELATIGPAPFCAMMLADHGADVIRIDRPGETDPLSQDGRRDILARSRRAITVDLKSIEGVSLVKRIAATADGLIEGFRPGVAERLGLGPDALLKVNPALVYAQMTGWGQEGPLAHLAGHDINYIAHTGTLAAIGPAGQPPVPPLNLIGDYGGGGMMLAFGFVTALLSARETGVGRVIDCSMIDGTSAMMAGMFSLRHNGHWNDSRGHNLLDGGAPFYACYACSDNLFVALGAIEHKFYKRLIAALNLTEDPLFAEQHDRTKWPEMKVRLAKLFETKPRGYWSAQLRDKDLCFSEVLTMDEVVDDHHNVARESFTQADGLFQPNAVPRFRNTAKVVPKMWERDSDREAILQELDLSEDEIAELEKSGAFGVREDPVSKSHTNALR